MTPALLRRRFHPSDLPLPIRFGVHRARLRWLEPDDLARLRAFFATHTPETIHQRYGYFFTQLAPETATRLVNIDRTRDAALGVFERDNGDGRLIAIGRYCLGPDMRSAELAFVVHEERRGLGIATTLCAALIHIARDRQLERLTAQVQWDNTPMLAILRRAGATFAAVAQTSAIQATLDLRCPAKHSREAAAAPGDSRAAAGPDVGAHGDRSAPA
jgi:acetyltransferase